jgi:putative ubiquitin-RnfH superfamily antitoxin RatB of RatAB toxin-antitoxin module
MVAGVPMRVTVAVATGPRQVVEAALQLPAGALLVDALKACISQPLFAGLDLRTMPAGVWGRHAKIDQVLHDGDRVELYRPLLVDPKVARRERFARQGARSTGLFAKKRPGAKSGY